MNINRPNRNLGLVFIGIFGMMILIWMWADDSTLGQALIKEDGVVESVGAMLFFLGGVICVIRIANKQYSSRRVLIFWAAICFFCFGEEISWFQRVFNYETPAVLAEKNTQKEFNLHNLVLFQGQQGQGSWVESGACKKFGFKLFFSPQNVFNIGFIFYFMLMPLFFNITGKHGWNYESEKLNGCFLFSVCSVVLLSFVLPFFSETENRNAIAETREMFYALFIFLYVLIFLKNTPVLKREAVEVEVFSGRSTT